METERDPGASSSKGLLTYEAEMQLSSIATFGTEAHRNIEESWKRPIRHNKRLELYALRDVLTLNLACAPARTRHGALPQLLSSDTDAAASYRWQSAVLVFDRTVPFGPWERQEMESYNHNVDPVGWGKRVTERYPELVAHWHQWLWLDFAGQPVRSREALGASAVLATACSELGTIAYQALGAHATAIESGH